MDATPPLTWPFLEEIRELIRATETRLPGSGEDREARLQREAFAERSDRALTLASRLAEASPAEADLLDGDACRARDALALSLDFFRRRCD